MVGVSDIPILRKVVERISEAGADVFFLGLSYLFCYKKLVNELDTEIKKVNIQENLVNQKSGEASASGYIIKDHVLTWQKEVKEFQESGEEFSKKYKDRASWTCLKCLSIPKPISRFQLGREAARTTNKATDLVNSGKELLTNEIADPPPTDDLPNPAVEFQDFASRKYVYGKLWEALITEGSSLILGIYGMAGVGKTRMVEQLWKEAKEKKKFDKVVRANVGSEELNIIKLQDQIAADLTCRFDSLDNVKSRASQLKHSLLHWGKVLLILDDVWSEIPLDNIIGAEFGESSSSKGSKILLTSRSEYVCLQNKCKHPVPITSLTDEDEIQHIRQPRTSFSKLTILKIERCSAMKYLFCKSVAICVAQLQELDISYCRAMEAIVMDEGTSDGEIIDLSKLRKLRLVSLKSLRSFYRENKEMHRGSADKSVLSSAEFPPLFDEMVAFPSLEYLTIKDLGEHTTCIWGSSVSSTSFCKLKRLTVYECSKLESVIPVSMLNRLHNLEHLGISYCSRLRNAFPPCIARDLIRLEIMGIHSCGMMTEIIGGGDQQKQKEISDNEDHDIIVFPNLTELNLFHLHNLTGFRAHQNGESNTCKLPFPSFSKLLPLS